MKKIVTAENIDDLHPDIRNVVDEVVSKIAVKDIYFFDLITIVAIANCVVSVIRLLYACYGRNAERALSKLERPGLFTRIFIKRAISENTGFYRRHGNMPCKDKLKDDIFSSLRAQAKEMKPEDVKNILGIYKTSGIFNKGE